MKASHKLKKAAYDANMEIFHQGIIRYTFGNASAADQAEGIFAIKPSGIPYPDLSEDKMVLLDFEGNVLEGSLRPSSDTPTHTVLYRHFPEISGIVHTHSPYAVAWAQAGKSIPILGTTHADYLPSPVPCTKMMKDSAIEGNYEIETGMQIINAFKELDYRDIHMVLVAGHGPFTWGKDSGKAAYYAVMLEELAKMAFLTLALHPQTPELKRSLIRKHYDRKHGTDAYYGQVNK